MAGGGPHAQPPSPPAGGRGALGEAVGGMWSALVLGLLAAIFAWFWFGGSGESEDNGAAASQPGARPVATARKEVDGEEQGPDGCSAPSEVIEGGVKVEKSASKAATCQSQINAERTTEIISELEETDICNTKANFSSSQDFPPKVDTTRGDQCDENERDHVDQRAPQNGPAPQSVYQQDFSELLQLKVAASAVEVVQHSVHQSAEEARSSVQNPNASEKAQFTVWEEPIAAGHSTVQEAMSCAARSVGAAQSSMLENGMNVVKVGESAQIRMQEGVMNATQAVCVPEALLDVSPIAEAEQRSVPEGILNNVPTKQADQSSVQDTALHATPYAEAVQSSEQEKASLLNDGTTAESAVEPTVQVETEAVALQIAEAMSLEAVPGGVPAVEAPHFSKQDSALAVLPSDEEQPIMHEGVPNAILFPEEKQLGEKEAVLDAPRTDDEPGHSLQEGGEATKFSGQEVPMDSSGPEEAVLSAQLDSLGFSPTAPAVHLNQVECDLIHAEAEECSVQGAVPDISITSEVAQLSVQEEMLETSQGFEATKYVPGTGECISHTSHLSSDDCKLFHTAEPLLQNPEGDSKMRKIAAVTPMPQNVSVKFRVHYITHSDSQLIAVTGNHESLGEWDVFVPLKPDKDGFWSDSVLLPGDSSVEWKFVMVESGKIRRWEECNNRSLKTGHDDAEAHQWWGYH
ncbi:starch-binding domain-containing protein 1 [Lissotriton helveticus]